MLPPELANVILNGGSHAILGVLVLALWAKLDKLNARVIRQAEKIGRLEADLKNCIGTSGSNPAATVIRDSASKRRLEKPPKRTEALTD